MRGKLVAWSYKHKTGQMYPDTFPRKQDAQNAIFRSCAPEDFEVIKVEIRETAQNVSKFPRRRCRKLEKPRR